jgi:hypothetical protein
METLLNVLWLIVALGLIGLWKFRWRRARRTAHGRILPEVIAICCAISLLLPAISLTDDLHPEVVAVDAVSGKRNRATLAARASRVDEASRKSGIHSAAALLALSTAEIELRDAGCVIFDLDSNPAWQCVEGFGRSPPSSI